MTGRGAYRVNPTPRSVVFDLLGDYVRDHRGGGIQLLSMIQLLDAFDVAEPTARVLMARLRREGWFETRRVGRQAIYDLSTRTLQLIDEGRNRIFRRTASPWDGRWYMVIYSVPESDRDARDRVRKILAWLGFGPLASSTWISPHDRIASLTEALTGEDKVRLDLLSTTSGSLSVDRTMAARCWDLEKLNRDYDRLLTTINQRLPEYRAGRLSDRDALVERTDLVHEYRLLPFRDPDLPIELLPTGWVGHVAHVAFLEAYEALREPAERFYLSIAESPQGARASS